MKICLTTIIREIEIKFQLLVRMWGNGNSYAARSINCIQFGYNWAYLGLPLWLSW